MIAITGDSDNAKDTDSSCNCCHHHLENHNPNHCDNYIDKDMNEIGCNNNDALIIISSYNST